ncbi:MAG: cytochrome c oxidase subunit 3 [Pseudomonadota bacterium]
MKYRPVKYYYLPQPSRWPVIGALGLFFLALSVANFVHGNAIAHYMFFGGSLLLVYMMFGWFSSVINESMHGLHSAQMDRTYRWGMVWFIVSEVAFFTLFFGALFYARVFALPVLGGDLAPLSTHQLLWPQFKDIWPLLKNPNPQLFPGPNDVIAAFGIPALNTFLLLSSAGFVTWAHWGLKANRRWQMKLGLAITILLGATFLCMQAFEYTEAYTKFDLTLHSGIYGTTFFMLTGFHAAHVTLGLTMLIVIFIRCLLGHFQPEHHFAFEAVSWYWHFVDVVWLFLFIFVYWF